ncbi:MAG: lytic transglycosylase domain-containing protein, partial [Hydrogenophaga sp.]
MKRVGMTQGIQKRIGAGLRLIMAGALLHAAAACAQSASGGSDATLLEMREAFRRSNTAQLDNLLPQARGHALEPLAMYWAMRPRLENASPFEIRAALDRMAGTYWEDRLRNDWLLLLGKARNWAVFEAELPKFRMQDDRQVRCYGLMLDAAAGRVTADAAAVQVQINWLAQREAEDGCTTAAQALLASGHLKPEAVWQRARLAMDTNRPRVASQAVALLDPERASTVDQIASDPSKYLDDKITAIRPRTKELVTLAIIRLAANDPVAAAVEADHVRWKTQLTKEERSWIWGVIGKRSAQKLQPEALSYFANGEDRFMHDEHLAWKARAGMRAGAWGHVRDAVAAMSEAQRNDPAWVYWKGRAVQAL